MRPRALRLLLTAAVLVLLRAPHALGKGSSYSSSSRSYSGGSSYRSSRSYGPSYSSYSRSFYGSSYSSYRQRYYGSRSYYYSRSSYYGPHYYGYNGYGHGRYSCYSCSRNTNQNAKTSQKTAVNILGFEKTFRINFNLTDPGVKSTFYRSLVQAAFSQLGLSSYKIAQEDISVNIFKSPKNGGGDLTACPTMGAFDWVNDNYTWSAGTSTCKTASRPLANWPLASCVQVEFVIFQVTSSASETWRAPSSSFDLKTASAQTRLLSRLLSYPSTTTMPTCGTVEWNFNGFHSLENTTTLRTQRTDGIRSGWGAVPTSVAGTAGTMAETGMNIKFTSKTLTSEYDTNANQEGSCEGGDCGDDPVETIVVLFVLFMMAICCCMCCAGLRKGRHGTGTSGAFVVGGGGVRRTTDCEYMELPPHLRQACDTLGFSAQVWDNDGAGTYSSYSFADMAPAQQEAAAALGYTAYQWDNDQAPNPVKFGSGTMGGGTVNPVAVGGMPMMTATAVASPMYQSQPAAVTAPPPAAGVAVATPVAMPMAMSVATPVAVAVQKVPTTVNITIPPGVVPGQQLQITPPSGGVAVMITVPAGCVPGQTLAITLP